MNYRVKPKKNLKGTVKVAPDKSISHRSIMFGSISKGKTHVENFLIGDDCIGTINIFKKMGIDINLTGEKVIIQGKGLNGLKKASENLDVGNSGTTIRLMTGLLSAQNFDSIITGDDSIKKRPMKRVIDPLKQMGANIEGINERNFAPLKIKGKKLIGIEYKQDVASAQVKSAILLASLYADGNTKIIEPYKSRNHSELLLNYLGANIKVEGNIINSSKINKLIGSKIVVPNDISSAAFFIVAALICDNSEIKLIDIGINETRRGIIDVLIRMGANILIDNIRNISGEEICDCIVKSSDLKGITIEGDIIPKMIDEIPIFAVAALFAEGRSIIKDASELKVKESNRIKAVVTEFKKFGANIEETEDGMIINTSHDLIGCSVLSYNDHRIAMSLAILGLKAKNETIINNSDCANVSFPDFFKILESI